MQMGGRGKETLFESTVVHQWLEDRAIKLATGNVDQADEKELKREKLRAETTIAKIEVLKIKGEVVYIQEVIDDFVKGILECKAKLRNIPNRITPQIIGETDEHFVNERLMAEIDDALEILDQSRFVRLSEEAEEDDEGGDETLGATA